MFEFIKILPIKFLTPILPLRIFVVKDGYFCHNYKNEYEDEK